MRKGFKMLNRRIVLSVFAGGVLSLIIAAATFIKLQRPSWDDNALTAYFVSVTELQTITENGSSSDLSIAFAVRNNTDQDYRLKNNENFELFIQNQNEVLVPTGYDKIFCPLFIPAKSKVELEVWSTFDYGGPFSIAEALLAKNLDIAFLKLVHRERPTLKGFVLFDGQRRYKLMLPIPSGV